MTEYVTTKSDSTQSDGAYTRTLITSARRFGSRKKKSTAVVRCMAVMRKLGIALCRPTGTTVVSFISLYTAIVISSQSAEWFLQAAVTVISLRVIIGLTYPRPHALPGIAAPLAFKRVVTRELVLSAAFATVCFLAGWPMTRQFLALFIGINLLLHMTMLPLTRLVVSGVTPFATNGSSPCARRVLIVGTGRQARQAADVIVDSPEMDTFPIGFLDYHRTGFWRYRDIPLVGHPERLSEIVSNGHVDAVFLAVEQEDVAASQRLFRKAEEMGVTVAVMPSMFRADIARAGLVDISGLPALIYTSTPTIRLAMIAKRLIDPVAAIIGLIVLSPFLLAVAIWIKLDSKGPVLFSQSRAGLNGRTFKLYKFRTMCCDAEEKKEELCQLNEMSGPVFKIKRDPRVTRVGRILRKYSIDELPQLLNIVKGDMSLVGPRPALPKEVSQYEPWQHRKLSVKPGLTCLWQVNGRNNIEFEEWMRLDLQYIDNWSLWLDAKLLARTIPTVLKGTGM